MKSVCLEKVSNILEENAQCSPGFHFSRCLTGLHGWSELLKECPEKEISKESCRTTLTN